MDLMFLLGVWGKVKDFKPFFKTAKVGDIMDLQTIRGLRIFGRRVGLTMTFDIEG